MTLRGLFLQFLTFFSSTTVDQDHGDPTYIGDYLLVVYVRKEQLDDCLKDLAGFRWLAGPQTRLKNQWDSDNHTVISLPTTGRLISHKVKDTPGATNRIHMLEYINPRWEHALRSITRYTCKRCPYGSSSLPHHSAPLADAPAKSDPSILRYMTPSKSCNLLDNLPDDILFTLAGDLPSETLISFGNVYPRFHAIVTSSREFVKRELQCFFLKTPLKNCILGVGVRLDAKSRNISSDFDWLSQEAFNVFGVRNSIMKSKFQYFLPLAFSRAHFEAAEPKIWKSLDLIHKGMLESDKGSPPKGRGQGGGQRQPPPTKTPPQLPMTQISVTVVFRMMNRIVVALMKDCDNALDTDSKYSHRGRLAHASEKAMYSYCHLFHLLICLVRKTPSILSDATQILERVIQNPKLRSKDYVPDLGEFIVLVTLVLVHPGKIKWAQISGIFLEEVFIRNVRWLLREHADLEIREEGVSQYRLGATFAAGKTSMRLIMFQVTLLRMFVDTYSDRIESLDDNYGVVEKELPEKMVSAIKEIYQVSDWHTFFKKVDYAKGVQFSDQALCGLLRDAVKKSGARGYHTPVTKSGLAPLSSARQRLESSWLANNKRARK